MPEPFGILKHLHSVSARIEAVAKDLDSGTDLFAEVDPYELAALLGLVHPSCFVSRIYYGVRISLEEYLYDYNYPNNCPIYELLWHLKGKVPPERIKDIFDKSKAFESGVSETDAELTSSEKRIIEDSITINKVSDGGCGPVIATETIRSKTGIELPFQAVIGDSGDCEGCYGPYQIRDGQGYYVGDDLVECMST